MYDAFISYRHSADAAVAAAVERGLERLARPWNRLRALSVFRDQSDLAAEHDLTGAITRRLETARFLVLLASPQSARSPWVEKEVLYWCEHRSGLENVIVVVTGGIFEWDESVGALSASTDAVSATVRSLFTTEPLYVDLRWAGGEAELSLRDSRFRAAIVVMAATIRGVAPADLESEDIRLHRRARRLARAAVATVVVLALAASVAAMVAVANWRQADRRAQQALGRQLGLAALDVPASEVDQAFLLSLAAAGLDSGPDAQRFQASRELMARYSRLDRLLYAPAGTTRVGDVAISRGSDQRIVATVANDGATELLTWAAGAPADPLRVARDPEVSASVSFTSAGSVLIGDPSVAAAGAAGRAILVTDPTAPAGTGSHRISGALAVDPARTIAVTSDGAGSLQVTDLRNGEVRAHWPGTSSQLDARFGRVASASDDGIVVVSASDVARSDPGTPAAVGAIAAGPDDETAAVTVSAADVVRWRRVGDRLEADARTPLDSAGEPHTVVVSPDGARVLVVGDRGAVVLHLSEAVTEDAAAGVSGKVAVDPAGQYAAVGGARLTMWDLTTGRRVFSVPRPVNAMAWSGPCEPDRSCVLATVGESLDVWRPQSGEHVELLGQTSATAVDVAADGQTVVTAGWGPTVAVWRLLPIPDDSSRRAIDGRELAGDLGGACGASGTDDLRALSPDATLMVVRSRDDATTTVCETASGAILARGTLEFPPGPTGAIAVDDDGNVVIGAAGFVARYPRDGAAFQRGRAVDARPGGEEVDVVALAHHAGTVAAGLRPSAVDATARVLVWSLDAGGTPAQFETDQAQVAAVALLGAEADVLAIATRDHDDGPVTLQILETATRRFVGRALRGLVGDVVVLRGDESEVFAADAGGRAYRWDVGRDPTRDICRIVGRPLTLEEWDTLAGGALRPYPRRQLCAG